MTQQTVTKETQALAARILEQITAGRRDSFSESKGTGHMGALMYRFIPAAMVVLLNPDEVRIFEGYASSGWFGPRIKVSKLEVLAKPLDVPDTAVDTSAGFSTEPE